jgi:hypothetical protein
MTRIIFSLIILQYSGETFGGNSSSKAFGISFADRPKAKRTIRYNIAIDIWKRFKSKIQIFTRVMN